MDGRNCPSVYVSSDGLQNTTYNELRLSRDSDNLIFITVILVVWKGLKHNTKVKQTKPGCWSMYIHIVISFLSFSCVCCSCCCYCCCQWSNSLRERETESRFWGTFRPFASSFLLLLLLLWLLLFLLLSLLLVSFFLWASNKCAQGEWRKNHTRICKMGAGREGRNCVSLSFLSSSSSSSFSLLSLPPVIVVGFWW